MNATKIITVTAIVGILIAAGAMLGKWASEESAKTEARYADAMSVLINQ